MKAVREFMAFIKSQLLDAKRMQTLEELSAEAQELNMGY